LTNSQRKRVKTEAELTFIRATNAVARGDLATAFKDLNRALLLEPSNTKVCLLDFRID
jgi:Flp pilus assembly protein TadD